MDWQQKLALVPHPEGGWYRRIHTAQHTVQTSRGPRQAASSIHYLLTAEQPRGRFHRVHSTILHYLQSGGPVQYACLLADGSLQETTLGFAPGQAVFLEVPPGIWKCSRLLAGADHALISEVVLPGFDWTDHEFFEASQWSASTQKMLQERGWLD